MLSKPNIHLVTPMLAVVNDAAAPEAVLVERTSGPNGDMHEVFEIDGELIVVESWNAEPTIPDAPNALRRR